jgi:hypothetical protein
MALFLAFWLNLHCDGHCLRAWWQYRLDWIAVTSAAFLLVVMFSITEETNALPLILSRLWSGKRSRMRVLFRDQCDSFVYHGWRSLYPARAAGRARKAHRVAGIA